MIADCQEMCDCAAATGARHTPARGAKPIGGKGRECGDDESYSCQRVGHAEAAKRGCPVN